MVAPRPGRPVARSVPALEKDPQWYKDAIIYQLHVRSFADTTSDGVGDFDGLTEKLDYLRDLGVNTLWLLPFYPSPLKDDGYDIADYTAVNPVYGTIADFKRFLKEAHARGLRVITELVLNHTSDQHEWFQRARRAPAGSKLRDWYVWSDTPDKYRDARIIFKDFESSNWTWDPVANAYFWHRFYHHQPDLNFDNPDVHKALTKVLDFWLDLGVDGLRLDAVPYLYEREGTNCENLPETHAFLKKLRAHVDQKYGDRMLLAEANQWPEDAAAYFGQGKGDECHTAFHFPVMPRLFMAVRHEDRFPIIDILQQTPPIPETSQWFIFLRNHDELTLEMVTDEERDYMYRVYATDPRARINLGIRRRLAPLMGNDRRRIELMNGLLLSLPGTPVLYYGDEIGMGDNIYLGDRNGVRTPMQWSSDRNAGFSRANPQKLYLPVIIDPEFHYEALNVESQSSNMHSLLWWMRRLVALRKQYKAFGRGTLEFVHGENPKVLSFVRTHGAERILFVANLSRWPQFADLPLEPFVGQVPIELFGRTPFPAVTDRPYRVSLGPHAFYLFALESPGIVHAEPAARLAAQAAAQPLTVRREWTELLLPGGQEPLLRALRAWLPARRWFRGKTRTIKDVALREEIPLQEGAGSRLVLVDVDYADDEPETYLVALAQAKGAHAHTLRQEAPGSIIATLSPQANGGDEVLFDAFADPATCKLLLDTVMSRRVHPGLRGSLVGRAYNGIRALREELAKGSEPVPIGAEQSNTSVNFGGKVLLKVFRRIEPGVNPDVELSRFLSEGDRFAHTPTLIGALDYESDTGDASSLGVVQSFVPNQGDAWRFTTEQVRAYYERILTRIPAGFRLEPPKSSSLGLVGQSPPKEFLDVAGGYLETARLLGRRTGELHKAFAAGVDAMAPEPFSTLYQRSIYQSMRSHARTTLPLLRRSLGHLAPENKALAEKVLAAESRILARYQALLGRKLNGQRIRIHGDYHLGQVLYTGRDFAIIDFEGEPARALSERRIKRSPLRDVAGMLRSFHYAAQMALDVHLQQGLASPAHRQRLDGYMRAWVAWAGAAFLDGYLSAVAGLGIVPQDVREQAVLLEAFLLEKAVYEIAYELNNRPDWAHVALRGVLELLEDAA